MKFHPVTHLLVSNTAALDSALEAINAITGTFHELTLGEGEKKKRYLYCKYGTYPQDVPGVGRINQVVDREAANEIAANFRQYAGLDVFVKGIPHFEGHPDDPGWLKQNPGHKAIAVGRIKTIEAGADGIYVESVFNSSGVEMLSGEAPPYTGHSPRWKCAPIEGRPGYFRPVMLMSDGLTNNPNIPGSTVTLNTPGNPSPTPPEQTGGQPEKPETMKLTPEALKALGFAPDANPSEADISAAVVKLLGEKETAAAERITAETATTTANSRVTALETELTTVRNAAVEVVVGEAVKTGRITEAEKPKWVTALNTDFPGESTKLQSKMPVINTTSRLPENLGERREMEIVTAPGTIEAMNAAVRAYASEHHLDITTPGGFNSAWNATKAAKPDLFKPAAK